MLHLFFKFTGAFLYLFMSLIVSSTMTCFLSIFFAIVMDFWLTKNVTGRLLVGMRWWNDTEDEDGHLAWTFESYDCDLSFNGFDTNIFWWGMAFQIIFWGFMFVGKALSINFLWGMLTFVATLLSASNLWGYYKCYRFHRNKMSNIMNDLIGGDGFSLGQKLLGSIF